MTINCVKQKAFKGVPPPLPPPPSPSPPPHSQQLRCPSTGKTGSEKNRNLGNVTFYKFPMEKPKASPFLGSLLEHTMAEMHISRATQTFLAQFQTLASNLMVIKPPENNSGDL